jgi:hypothetical protein
MYSGEVSHLAQDDLLQLVALGRQLQLVGILCSERRPHPHSSTAAMVATMGEEEDDDDVFETEVAVDLSPGAR